MFTPAYALNLLAKTMDSWFPAVGPPAAQHPEAQAPHDPHAPFHFEVEATALGEQNDSQPIRTQSDRASKYASWPWSNHG